MMAAKRAGQEKISIPRINLQEMEIVLVGDSPLVVHSWSDKARKMMLDKQMKKATPKKEAKDPERDFLDSLYWYDRRSGQPEPTMQDVGAGKFGFPTIAFKSAAVDACSHVASMTKVSARGAFHLNGELVQIEGKVRPREDMVRVGMGVADIRYRGEFMPWRVRLSVRYNADVLSVEQIVNLFNVAGFAIGVGEHRPEKNGSWGMFHVATDREVTA